MKLRAGYIIPILLFFAQITFGQRFVLPENPVAFGDTIPGLLRNTGKDAAIITADEFAIVYGSLSLDVKQKIIEQARKMQQKKWGYYPQMTQYFQVINQAINSAGLTPSIQIEYLNMTGEMINNHSWKEVQGYLKTMNSFFEKRALYASKANRLYAISDDFEFEYIPIVVPVKNDDPYGYATTDYYDTTTTYDDYYYDTGYVEPYYDPNLYSDPNYDPYALPPVEEYVEPDPLEYFKPKVTMPEASGPVIRFPTLVLNMVTSYDSLFINGTSGYFNILTNEFVGSKGKVNWESAGLSADTVFAQLADYTFISTRPEFKAIDAKLTYRGKLSEPIEGIFEFKSVRHDSLVVARFPKFLSYRAGYRIKDIAPNEIKFVGALSLNGAKISTDNLLKEPSSLDIPGPTGKMLKTESLNWSFEDSVINSPGARLLIIHKRDSITHPSMKMQYNVNSKLLRISKEKGPFSDTPISSTYFNMNMITEEMEWDMNTDSLNMMIKSGKKWVPTVFESIDHYEKASFLNLKAHYNFNPLIALVVYYKKTGQKTFYVSEAAAELKLNNRNLSAASKMLEQKGLVEYNEKTDEVTLRHEGIHMVDANFGKEDYDDLIVESIMDEHPELPNATIYFEDERIEVRGVEYFGMSDSLKVDVTPDSGVVTILKNRDIRFDGQIDAGNFRFSGKDFTFKYDSFLVNMGVIDEVKFFVTDSLGNRRPLDNTLVGVDSTAASIAGIDAASSATKGTLYINSPVNKSGLIKYPHFPNFNAGMGGVVYFDRPEIFNGIYDRSIFFVAPPFKIDSLGDNDPSAIEFDGVFASSGMFPVFEEKLATQPDNSLGFYHIVPDKGYQLFEGAGKLTGDISLNKRGIRSSGRIDFLSTSLESDDFIFYPDSVTGMGSYAEIREEEFEGVIFPQADLSNYRMKWLPRKDSMYVYNTAEPFSFYEGTASLDGAAIISNNGVFGQGTLKTRGSIANSNELTFNHNNYSAKHADFLVETDDPNKPALSGDNVRLNFNLDENYAEISPEVEGTAAVDFPYAQFKTSIPTARWDLNQQKILMFKPDDIELENSYFYTTRQDLDSLRFNAIAAEYDMETQELRVMGIPYIVVADAQITPDNNQVLILENSVIGTLTNTVIILDTLTAHHRLYDGVIDIKSRNEFSGHATYELVNAVGDTFAIKMTDFRLEEFTTGEGRRIKTTKHTVANGSITAKENILISPGMFFKGSVKLEAQNPMLHLDGYIKLNLMRDKDNDTWIHYMHSADQAKISIDFDKSLTEEGRVLFAGLYFSSDDFSLYHAFINNKKGMPGDEQFFKPSGKLFYDEVSKIFIIEDPLKTSGQNFSGKSYSLNEASGDISFEGPVNFFKGDKHSEIKSAVLASGNIDSLDFELNTFMAINFDVPSVIWDIIGYDLQDVIENLGAPEGLGDPTELLYKVAEIMGETATKDYEQQTLKEYVSLGGFTNETTKPLVFSDVNLKWSKKYKSFYSNGLLGMSNILDHDVNAAWEGFMEIGKMEDGSPYFNLFFKASGDSWYYLNWQDNRLMMFSSNEEFNSTVAKKSNAAKAKIGELVFLPGDKAEALAYINRFRSQYYGILDEYVLDSDAKLEEKEKKKETDATEEGF